MILGDLGADVIKVETPGSGDDTRSWGPPFAPNKDPSSTERPESAYFLGVNRNKRSITVNFKAPEGLDILHRLARTSDVVIENFVPGKLDSMGLGYEELSRLNPRLIYASITGYGPTGPYSGRSGYDVIIEAEAGLMHITGEPDGPPVKVGTAVTDLATGLYAHGAILAALLARGRTGRGQKVDVSLLETQVTLLANVAHSYLIGGVEARRWGTQHSSIVPYQAFPTADGSIVFGAGNDRQYAKLCTAALERPDLAADPRFATNGARVKHRRELVRAISDVTRTKPTAHWLRVLEPLGVPFGPVNSIAQTFEHPQVRHRNMVVEVDHPKSGPIKLVGIPVKYSDTTPSIRRAPPVLGQDTRDVLVHELGFSHARVDELAEKGVI
ncbi:hypothetical protein HK105_205790 [Polyrhizophydium stewartii]|uniref:Uncharacterized protein n=1 Tax=Polyrhizophydium stewartii TaxID=2732419 RepID=A0ABR4N526_9FUNG|nr:hypothetical protein HK105_007922 [Polyrhizophydium stewartii]